MKTLFSLLLLWIGFTSLHAQTWSRAQIEKANTAKDIAYLSTVEKECIMYLNLCRLYPQDFLKFELTKYVGNEQYGDYLKNSDYRKSLISTLASMQPINALTFDADLYKNAACFAKEQGIAGTSGHTRIKCPKITYAAECCSYGMSTAKDIVLQLLIDDRVTSLGHRKICLDAMYSKIGVSVGPHKVWGTCAVFDSY
jgi:uncharacterized protein YkwD